MISPDLEQKLAKAGRTAAVIWGAFLAGPLFYIVLAWLVTTSRTEPRTPPAFALPGLALLAVAMLGIGITFLRSSFTDAALRKAPETVAKSGQPGIAAPAGATPREQRLYAVLSYGQTYLIIVWACFEAIAVYGLIGVFLGLPAPAMLPFALIAMVAIALNRPRLVELVRRAEEFLPQK